LRVSTRDGRLTILPFHCCSCALVPKEEADIAILEEPEHLTWFRVPPESNEETALLGWQFKFNFVVGILHTNYSCYMKQYGLGAAFIGAPALSSLSSIVVRAYCHRLIRLSATLPVLDLSRETTCNVHGVRSEFFEASEDYNPAVAPSPIYFIGKLIWAKGKTCHCIGQMEFLFSPLLIFWQD
jgi:digalactosyldiacylglycerol synthase